MRLKSTATRYGATAVAIHWATALLIVAQLAGGFVAAQSGDAQTKASILRMHAPLGILVLVLTLVRIGWWAFVDRRPAPMKNMPPGEALAVRGMHLLLYGAMLFATLSGVALMAMSGAGRTLFGGDRRPLPDFSDFAPFHAHLTAVLLLALLLAGHVGAALYHQFIRRDRLFDRIGIGRASP
jgi:cytochrome b561